MFVLNKRNDYDSLFNFMLVLVVLALTVSAATVVTLFFNAYCDDYGICDLFFDCFYDFGVFDSFVVPHVLN